MSAGGLGDVAAELPPRAGVAESEARAADRAGDRLGVVAAVERVLVLAAAVRAHGESGHGRPRPVVGEAADDRVARAAVRAVGEGVAVAALAGRRDLLEAVRAGGDVGGDEDEARGGARRADLEAPAALERGGTDVEPLDDGQGREPGPQGGRELVADRRGRAFDVDLDAGAGVLDPAVEPEAAGQAIDVGPEADALDDAEDGQAGGGPRVPGVMAAAVS